MIRWRVFFGILALVVGAYFWWQHAHGRPDHFVRINGETSDEFWVYDIRELWAEVRDAPDSINAKLRYDLRRVTSDHWEMRLVSRHPAARNFVFPSLGLRAAESEYDETTLAEPWTDCGQTVGTQLEEAHCRYNDLGRLR